MHRPVPSFLQVQVGRHLLVALVVGFHPVLSVLVGLLFGAWAGSLLLTWPVFSTIRSHGAPHISQAFGLVPANMQGSISFGGKVLPVINIRPFFLATHVPAGNLGHQTLPV